MILVNLFGTPGAGKSSGAAYIFSQLKMAGVNAELVTEFAKDKVYEENKEVFNNQAYIFGKQFFRLTRCQNKVDVIVTDSPLLLSVFYNTDPILGDNFNALVTDVFRSYTGLNYFLYRDKPYNPNGRFQTEQQSNDMVKPMLEFLADHSVDYVEVFGNKQGYDEIIGDVLALLKEMSSPPSIIDICKKDIVSGEESLFAIVSRKSEIIPLLVKACKEITGLEPQLIRHWTKNGRTMYDVGCHQIFFYVEGLEPEEE